MEFKKNTRKILSILLLAAILFTFILAPLSAFAESIGENQSKKQDLSNKSSGLKSKLDALKNDAQKKQEYKNTLDEQISVIRQEVDLINDKISELDDQILQKEEMIENTQADIDKNYRILKHRLKAIYMAGDISNIEIILGAKDFSDFLDKAEIIKTISDHDSKLINNLKTGMDQIKEEKRIIEENKQIIFNEKIILDEKQDEFLGLASEIEEVIAELKSQEENVKNEIDENDSEIQRINREIEAYYEEQAGGGGNIYPPTSGNYAWPVPGFYYISSDYFDTDSRNSMHRAIDIAGPSIYGARVVSSEAGRVILSCTDGYGGGYGNYVVIDHGNGKSTLYGHLSGVASFKGQTVSKGQTIGYVGNSGFSTGPHLHFETRQNGVKYNPMEEF